MMVAISSDSTKGERNGKIDSVRNVNFVEILRIISSRLRGGRTDAKR